MEQGGQEYALAPDHSEEERPPTKGGDQGGMGDGREGVIQ